MNKGIAFFMIMLVLWTQPYAEKMPEEELQQIPDEAIRLRILANSDAEQDQQLKRQVRDEVNTYINELVVDIADIEEARQTIRRSVPDIEKIVEATINESEKETTYNVEYRSNVSFPTKKYDTFIYPAGEYEAVLITLGKGEGANWWCVLFPPLCFLDFSNGTTVADVESSIDDEETNERDPENQTKKVENDVFEEVEDANETEEEVEIKFFLFDWLGLS